MAAAPARARFGAITILQQALACTFFAALVAVFARIAIPLPFTPVPFSLQPLAIMLTGMFLGSGPAFFALLEYLVAGALGAPVFAGGNGGWGYLMLAATPARPTLGYLLSYPIAAYAIGYVAERGRSNYFRLLGAGLAGLAIIYAGGYAHIFYLRGDAIQAFFWAVAWFIAFDVVKAAVAAGVASTTAASWFAWRRR
jgi:biotin transport system substrate-specific component